MTSQAYVPPFDQSFRLAAWDADDTGGLSKKEGRKLRAELTDRIGELQDVLYADGRYAVLIVLQGMDAAGKNSTIKHVFTDTSPHGLRVEQFGEPTGEELAHDFLWRCHRVAPALGEIAVFNRSHYEAVVVERVKELVPRSTWKRRYEAINDFERLLANEGTAVLKFYLNISKDEQAERLQRRLDRPDKRWKFRVSDLDDRAQWDEYIEAYEDAIGRCNTGTAPWHIVPADHKWYRDIVVAQAIIERLEALDLSYPQREDELDGVRVLE